MTFEQWTAEMEKGLSLQKKDGNPRGPTNQYDSIQGWNYDGFGGECEEEDSTYDPS